jgi:predicted metal-dependent enzyme (double-stranded beta helix superfamily)
MPSKSRTPVKTSALALRLANNRSLWEGLVRYDATSRYYARLAAEPDYEAWLLTWLPGQSTDWHDHGGSAGAFVVLQGVLTEQRALVSPDAVPRIVPSAQQYAVEALRPFGAKHIHKVANDGLAPAISLHVYSPGLAEMNYYEARDGLLWLTDSRLAGVNW